MIRARPRYQRSMDAFSAANQLPTRIRNIDRRTSPPFGGRQIGSCGWCAASRFSCILCQLDEGV